MDYTFNGSNWDLVNHIAIPTLKYIKDTTGLDLLNSGYELLADAENYVKRLTLEAKDKLFVNKSADTKMVLEYKIAYVSSYNNNWLRYAAQYVWASIYDPNDEKKSVFNARKNIDIYNFTYGVIYDVENSTLEW